MKLNIELLEKVKAHILSTPEAFEMGTWAEPSDEAPCGTVACIAGRAALIAHPGLRAVWDKNGDVRYFFGNNREADIAIAGARVLGFDDEYEGATLFFESRWPSVLYLKWLTAISAQERAEIAAERIDRYIAEYRREHGIATERIVTA